MKLFQYIMPVVNTDRFRALACIFLVAAIYVAFAGGLLFNNGFYIDDRLYLYTINFFVCEPASLNAASESLLAFLRHGPYSAEDVSIFQFRYAYSDNYLVHAAATCMTRVLMPQRLLDVDYGTWIYAVVQTGVGLSHLVCIGVVLWAIWFSRKSKTPYAILLTFGVLALLTIDRPSWNWRLTNAHSVIDFLVQTILFTVSPGFEFDIFGLTPRSDATLLFIAITIFRWQNRIDISYWMIVLISLVHGTYGALALVIFLTLDVVLQPIELRKWRCMAPISFTVLLTLIRIGSFEAFNGTLIQLGAIAIVAAAFGGLTSVSGERLLERLPFVGRLRGRSTLYAETLLLVIGMGVSVVVAFLVASISTGLTQKYVAHELSGRPIALLRVPVVASLCAIVTNIRINGSTRFWPVIVIAFSILAFVSDLNKLEHARKSWSTAEEMEPSIRTAISHTGEGLSRLQLYYVLSCGIDRKCPYLKELVAGAGGR